MSWLRPHLYVPTSALRTAVNHYSSFQVHHDLLPIWFEIGFVRLWRLISHNLTNFPTFIMLTSLLMFRDHVCGGLQCLCTMPKASLESLTVCTRLNDVHEPFFLFPWSIQQACHGCIRFETVVATSSTETIALGLPHTNIELCNNVLVRSLTVGKWRACTP